MSNCFVTKKIVRGQNYDPEFHVIFDPLSVEELLSIYTTCKASGSINEAVEEELLRRINRQPIVVSTKDKDS